jgi:hypothetical protein
VPPLDYSPFNQRIRELFALYAKARKNLIVGEGLIGEIIVPCVNEIRNGWDDVWQVLNGLTPSDSDAANDFLLDAERHFKRATSEVFEAVLLVRLDELCSILQSLRTDREFRIVKSRYYSALMAAFDRGRVALMRSKDTKHQTPDAATLAAKGGIAIVQTAIVAFMKKVGQFDLADEVHKIRIGQDADRASQRRSVALQIMVAILLVLISLWAGRAIEQHWPAHQTTASGPVSSSGAGPTTQP